MQSVSRPFRRLQLRKKSRVRYRTPEEIRKSPVSGNFLPDVLYLVYLENLITGLLPGKAERSAQAERSEMIVNMDIISFYGNAVDDFAEKGLQFAHRHIIPEIADLSDLLPDASPPLAEQAAFGFLAD